MSYFLTFDTVIDRADDRSPPIILLYLNSMSIASALRNTEIVSSIASYAYWGRNDYDTPLDLRNVLALALTCRAFLEPALDQLWRRQLNLFNLLKTLPSDAWEVYPGDYRGPDGRRQLLIVSSSLPTPYCSPALKATLEDYSYDSPQGLASIQLLLCKDKRFGF